MLEFFSFYYCASVHDLCSQADAANVMAWGLAFHRTAPGSSDTALALVVNAPPGASVYLRKLLDFENRLVRPPRVHRRVELSGAEFLTSFSV